MNEGQEVSWRCGSGEALEIDVREEVRDGWLRRIPVARRKVGSDGRTILEERFE